MASRATQARGRGNERANNCSQLDTHERPVLAVNSTIVPPATTCVMIAVTGATRKPLRLSRTVGRAANLVEAGRTDIQDKHDDANPGNVGRASQRVTHSVSYRTTRLLYNLYYRTV